MKTIFLILFTFFFGYSSFSQKELKQIKSDVKYLSSDKLMGRETGTSGEKMAAEYLVKRFKEIGLIEKGTNGYLQDFSVKPKSNPHSHKVNEDTKAINGNNIVGFIDHNAEFTLVFGAHYDHLGKGAEGSLHAAQDGQIHNGADDNASGVALILALAEELNDKNFNEFNYLFIAFSGEEKGLWGSNYYSKNPTIDLNKVDAMINFDMVGRLDTSKGIAVNGVGTSTLWNEIIEEANTDKYKLITSESGVGPSDHTSFYLVDIPVLHFFTGQHSDYHKPSDDADKVNYEGIASIEKMVIRLIEGLDGKEKLDFQTTKQDSSNTPRFTVTLGVMPDYMYQGDGMRLDGVTDGRPANKAGFQKGDIVIQMGENEVDGMQSYMEALSKFKKGDKAIVKVKRGEEILESEVTF